MTWDARPRPDEVRPLTVRTDCYFVEKAYNAEKAGAKAILVMDDREEQLLTMAAPEDRPEIAKLREDISIPTALIRRVLLSPQICKPPPMAELKIQMGRRVQKSYHQAQCRTPFYEALIRTRAVAGAWAESQECAGSF